MLKKHLEKNSWSMKNMFLHPHALITQIPNWILLRLPKIFCTFNTWSFQSTFCKAVRVSLPDRTELPASPCSQIEPRWSPKPVPFHTLNKQQVLSRRKGSKSSDVYICFSGKHQMNNSTWQRKYRKKEQQTIHSRDEYKAMLLFTTTLAEITF